MLDSMISAAAAVAASPVAASALRTRTGSFPIGFRLGWSEWQKDLPAVTAWAAGAGLSVIDLGANADTAAPTVLEAGLLVGSADLCGGADWKALLSTDESRRKASIDKITTYVGKCAAYGIRTYFMVLLPEDPTLERRRNLALASESLNALEPVLRAHDSRIVFEGWPGPGALACTPESCRAVFGACPSPVFGVNYDPSHLLRMGIDPVRFLGEFHSRVHHVHGKDTDIDLDALYEFGTEQPPTLATAPGFGGPFWRYTIPGQGQVPWQRIFRKLVETGYKGAVSIELEDAHFNGTTQGEKAGLMAAATYLAGV
ncbi:sugar phosphate isomerase/epimerase [Verrucomicrobia bacterium LW23]|nr:sugar phosphate isomerase/epimerase [Verrucomicrobia bacterium LW23]